MSDVKFFIACDSNKIIFIFSGVLINVHCYLEDVTVQVDDCRLVCFTYMYSQTRGTYHCLMITCLRRLSARPILFSKTVNLTQFHTFFFKVNQLFKVLKD